MKMALNALEGADLLFEDVAAQILREALSHPYQEPPNGWSMERYLQYLTEIENAPLLPKQDQQNFIL